MPDAKTVVQDWIDAIERKDVDRLDGLLAEDVDVRDAGTGLHLEGKTAIREFLAGALGGLGDVRVDVERLVQEGREVAVLARFRVTYADDVEVLGERLPTAGKTVEVEGAAFLTLNDEHHIQKVVRLRDSWQASRDLGLSPEQMARLSERMEQALSR